MNITIIGAGYVGLPSGVIFAEKGHHVWIVRRNKEKVELLKKGKSPIYEPGLEKLLQKNIKEGRLIATTDYKEAVPQADVVFICVGTPQLESGEADLSQVFGAAREIAENLEGYTVVVNKSTVPVGTGDKVKKIISEHISLEAKFDVASCPEFLREGQAVKDALNPDRIVIGADKDCARELLVEIHQNLPGERVITDLRTAEIIKYASNAILASQISFINMLARLCEESGADVCQVTQGLKFDKRIGQYAFLDAGLGYGGGCFPKDVEALIYMLKTYGCEAGILEEVQKVNKAQAHNFFDKISLKLGQLKDKTIGIWGLAFKPETDDLRESASLVIIKKMIKAGANIKAYDPVAEEKAKKLFPQVRYCEDIYEAVEGVDALVIATAWPKFQEVDLDKLRKKMKAQIIFDGRNIFDLEKMKENKFQYYSVGRPIIKK